ncbi:opine dehydrogenase [Variovorax boronicumulans]|uniref:NAD/NADP octopine/nopaline dehydrogenase family protein n=1 Tax=Variovorax TaxID=34072 RepID=UPI00277F03B1|nr:MULTISPECIES: NAD/NADP octopine/nopaline dehydrogenase family protein [Variovorax]MDQ0034015.1 opine dehydrogenase [Variovorax boronicumulans]MDQ0612015.1 opine dehydrogenase [Variovorax sp. W1I1]
MTEVSAGKYRVGIAGTGAIALASAAWLRQAGHGVTLWSPGGRGAEALRTQPLEAGGVQPCTVTVEVADDAAQLCHASDVLLLALPVNGHKQVMDALLPSLRDGQTVIVSSMASLSSLYLHEAARRAGKQVTVASFGTTVLTARRESGTQVRVMTRRKAVGVSALPGANVAEAVALCTALFGDGFFAQDSVLASALANVNPQSHGPLAVFNWTRIERAENWPQYHCMTPGVSSAIEALDLERRAVAQAFGIALGPIEEHFARSFGTASARLEDIAAELHAKRGGPPGPVRTDTRYVTEDMPYGLAFVEALGQIAGVPTPATRTIVDAASLVNGIDFRAQNDLLAPLGLGNETVAGLLARL